MSIKLRSKKLKDGSDSLYLDIYYRGKRNYEFLDIKIERGQKDRKQKKELAENIRSKRELELTANKYNILSSIKSDEDFLKFYEDNCKDSSYKASFKKLKEFSKDKLVLGKLPFHRVDESFCEAYKDWLLTKIGNNTTWVYIYKLKAICNKAIKQKFFQTSPTRFVQINHQETEKVYLTIDEVTKLYNTDSQNEEIKKAFLFSCYTGLRLSDIKELSWGQIREGRLFFKQKKTKGIEYLPLSKTALEIINSGLEKNIIPLPDMKVFNLLSRSEDIGNNLRKWAKKAEINKYITFHTARHTFATMLLTKDVDLYTVSKMLGHKSINTTQIYAKIVDSKLTEAVNKLPAMKKAN